MQILNRKCVLSWNDFTNMIVAIFLWVGSTLALDGKVLVLLLFLLVTDAVTGFWKSVVLKKTTSDTLVGGLLKKMLIILIPMVIAASGVIMGKDLNLFVNSIYSFLALGEAYSIIANIASINTKKEMAEFEVFEVILQRIALLIKGK